MNVNYSPSSLLEKKSSHIFVTSSRVEEFAKPILQRTDAKAVLMKIPGQKKKKWTGRRDFIVL